MVPLYGERHFLEFPYDMILAWYHNLRRFMTTTERLTELQTLFGQAKKKLEQRLASLEKELAEAKAKEATPEEIILDTQLEELKRQAEEIESIGREKEPTGTTPDEVPPGHAPADPEDMARASV
jgi:hypothetical protein